MMSFREVREHATADCEILKECLYVVDYHLQRMERSIREALDISRPSPPIPYTFEESKYVTLTDPTDNNGFRVYPRFDFADICMAADDAIIAAASILDTSLQLTNTVLQLGIKKREVHWLPGRRNAKSVRTELVKRPQAQPLLNFLDKVYGVRDGDRLVTKSAGYELFNGYRNWVVHRGAPVLESLSADGSFVMCEEDLVIWSSRHQASDQNGTPNEESVRRMERYDFELDCQMKVSENVFVWSYPVVPPAQAHYSVHIEESPAGGMTLPGGIYIGEGSSNITIRNATASAGSLIEPLALYRELNPVDFASDDKACFAGETLVKYRLDHYLRGIEAIRWFVDQVITEWDRHLAEALVNS